MFATMVITIFTPVMITIMITLISHHHPDHPQTPAKPAAKGRGRRGKTSMANESVQVTTHSAL